MLLLTEKSFYEIISNNLNIFIIIYQIIGAAPLMFHYCLHKFPVCCIINYLCVELKLKNLENILEKELFI